MNEVTHYIDAGESINERVVMKEGYFDFGRITGFLFLMFVIYFLPKKLAMFIGISVLYGFSIIAAWYTKSYEDKQSRE